VINRFQHGFQATPDRHPGGAERDRRPTVLLHRRGIYNIEAWRAGFDRNLPWMFDHILPPNSSRVGARKSVTRGAMCRVQRRSVEVHG
jgi:hypothetical protein